MKRIIAILTVLALIFAFAGCSSGTKNESSEKATAANTETASASETTAENKTSNSTATSNRKSSVVVYFSRTGEQYDVGVIEKGNTAIVADMIVEQTGSDSFEILPKNDNYPMTYKELTDVYDTVYLGYPIWWGDLPMICYTFLESYDFSGKTIIPFCTHAGSGNAGTQSKIQSAAPNATVKEVLAIAGTDTQNDPDSVKTAVTEWLNK